MVMKNDALTKILFVINNEPKNMIFYAPNLATWAKVGIHETKSILLELTQRGTLEELKVPRYKGEIMEEFAVPVAKDFNWRKMQDPDDFTQIEKYDIEVSQGFRVL